MVEDPVARGSRVLLADMTLASSTSLLREGLVFSILATFQLAIEAFPRSNSPISTGR